MVYPNPVTGSSLFIRTGNTLIDKDMLIRMYSVNGDMVMSKRVRQGQSGLIEIKLTSTLSSGVYLIQLDDKHTVRLVIKK